MELFGDRVFLYLAPPPLHRLTADCVAAEKVLSGQFVSKERGFHSTKLELVAKERRQISRHVTAINTAALLRYLAFILLLHLLASHRLELNSPQGINFLKPNLRVTNVRIWTCNVLGSMPKLCTGLLPKNP